jgi:hypothetical protein
VTEASTRSTATPEPSCTTATALPTPRV